MLAYWLALALAVGTMAAIYALLRSRTGLALAAVRDNDNAARSVGVDAAPREMARLPVRRHHDRPRRRADLPAEGPHLARRRLQRHHWTAYVIFIVVIGGIGTIEGPILGVIVFWGLQTAFADYGSWYLLALGLLAIVTMLFAPRGLWGLIADRRGIALFPIQRRIDRRSVRNQEDLKDGGQRWPTSPPTF